jgi:hypothetical protein
MAATSKAYRDHDAATEAAAGFAAEGVPASSIRILAGTPLHDVREEQVGEFAGPVGPDAPVGSFAGGEHTRSEPEGTFASRGPAGRIGTFADADRDVVISETDGVGRIQMTDDHDVAAILRDAGVEAGTCEELARALHEGWVLVLVQEAER